jgi:hypothetical protein
MLVRSLAELGSEDSDLDLAQLIAQRRKAQEETLADKLNIVKYEIDSKDSIKLFGSGRIENVGCCLSACACTECSHESLCLFSSCCLYFTS